MAKPPSNSAAQRVRKKVRKNVADGVAHVHASFRRGTDPEDLLAGFAIQLVDGGSGLLCRAGPGELDALHLIAEKVGGKVRVDHGHAQAGVSEEDAHVYAEGVRRGGTLVTARVADNDRARIDAILDRASVNVRDRGAAYRKAGWQKFDTSAPSYTADQVAAERKLYGR